jgi:hypothetical protein
MKPPLSIIGTFSEGNFKARRLERIYYADATLTRKYIGNSAKGNRIFVDSAFACSSSA